ncbi:TonB-dependent receptor plug domain-containing protein [Sphingomonas sp. RS2018]
MRLLLATVSMGALQTAQAHVADGGTASTQTVPPASARSQAAATTAPEPVPVASQVNADGERAGESSGEGQINDIIVTGVGAASSARKANVAYSVLKEEDMAKFTPISADDMLRDMPGVVVETNDGVARNEVFTRGMTIGTGSNTSGYFWTTILEDGLPVIPFKFGGFQDGYFYRADISTSRVEAVRGGTTATSVSTSVGATFNYITGPVKAGGSVQVRIGFEGEDTHLSWKQIDGQYGWTNKEGDFGLGISGFYRRSNGPVNPGFDVNAGGQVRLRGTKTYTTDNGGGMFMVGYKHLDDRNGELTAYAQPVYGLEAQEEIAGFGRTANLYLDGPVQTVPNYFDSGTHTLDPTKGYRYRQDAVNMNWTHTTDSGWSFGAAVRGQRSTYRGQGFKITNPVSLAQTQAERERYGLNINNLDRTPGFYEFRDQNGSLMARVANNVNGSQLGTDYRTGLACPRVTQTTFQTNSLCVTYNGLPNRDIDLRGGTVTGAVAQSNGTFVTATLPLSNSSRDLLLRTGVEDSYRSSTDIMGDFTVGFRSEKFGFNGGLYVARARQLNQTWGNGQGLAPWADGQVQNLVVNYVTQAGTTYQLTDAQGWGFYGAGTFGTANQRATITEIAPRADFSWSPNRYFDFNVAAKYDHFSATTNSNVYDQRNSAAGSLTNGGLDGNPLTVYDNLTTVLVPSRIVQAQRSVGVLNWTASVGFNLSPQHKFYARYTDGKQPALGVVTRYSTPATLVRPLGPTAYVKGYELAYTFDTRFVSGAVTYFKQNFAVNDYPTAIDSDNVTTYLLPENFNRYFTRGVEAWARLRLSRRFEWTPSVTFLNGRTQAAYVWLNTGANGLGASDDVLRIDSGELSRTPRWTISNVASYRLGDFRFNLRHRWMSARRLSTGTVDFRRLPAQDNLDASIQWEPRRTTRVTFDIRNVTDTQYISSYDAALQTTLPSGIQAYDVVQQLPESLFLLKRNQPRSFWLTVRQDFK